MVDRLGIDTTLHKLRHHAATELIAAGVDVRTVAGRLGHSGGGTTTLRTYTAWVAEADQRAASGIGSRMPARPVPLDLMERAKSNPQNPYEKIAAELRRRILAGDLRDGDAVPTEKQLAAEHGVAAGTAHRAMELLKTWGLVKASRGHRAVVTAPALQSRDASAKVGEDQGRESAESEVEAQLNGRQYWAITLRGPDGRRYPPRHVCEDITRPDSFRAHLVAIARIEAATETNSGADWIGDYELEVRDPGKEHEDPKLTLRW